MSKPIFTQNSIHFRNKLIQLSSTEFKPVYLLTEQLNDHYYFALFLYMYRASFIILYLMTTR